MNATILETAINVNAATGTVTQGDPRLVGERARNAPVYTFNLWSTYMLTGHWKIGGGVEAKGKRFAYQPQQAVSGAFVNGQFTPNTAEAYQRWDAMVAYEEKHWALRLNIKNAFDRLYYDSISATPCHCRRGRTASCRRPMAACWSWRRAPAPG